MSHLSSLPAAPKYFSIAAAGITSIALMWKSYKSPFPSNIFADVGVLYATTAVSYNAAITVFSRNIVQDALQVRPSDAVAIMRSAGGRAGACVAANMIMVHIVMDALDADPIIPTWLGIYASTMTCVLAFPFLLPIFAVSYSLGSLVGSAIGRRMLIGGCSSGRLSTAIGDLYYRSPFGARILVGASVVLGMWPSYAQRHSRWKDGGERHTIVFGGDLPRFLERGVVEEDEEEEYIFEDDDDDDEGNGSTSI